MSIQKTQNIYIKKKKKKKEKMLPLAIRMAIHWTGKKHFFWPYRCLTFGWTFCAARYMALEPLMRYLLRG